MNSCTEDHKHTQSWAPRRSRWNRPTSRNTELQGNMLFTSDPETWTNYFRGLPRNANHVPRDSSPTGPTAFDSRTTIPPLLHASESVGVAGSAASTRGISRGGERSRATASDLLRRRYRGLLAHWPPFLAAPLLSGGAYHPLCSRPTPTATLSLRWTAHDRAGRASASRRVASTDCPPTCSRQTTDTCSCLRSRESVCRFPPAPWWNSDEGGKGSRFLGDWVDVAGERRILSL